MTACRRWKDRLLDYALEALPASPARELEAHLRGCPDCACAWEDLRARRRQMDAALAQLVRGTEPSPAFRARVLAAAEASPAAPALRPVWGPALAALAVLVLVAAFLPSLAERAAAPRQSVSLSDWRSPTQSLLRPPGGDWLSAAPRLGQFYFPLAPAPPDSANGKGGNDES